MKFLLLTLLILSTQLAFSQSMIVMNTGKVLTIDDQGVLNDLGNFLPASKIKKMGGRYAIDEKRKLRTVDHKGLMYNKDNEEKVPRKIKLFGDNYFVSKKGKMFTINDSGISFAADKESEFRHITHNGGNFVITEKDFYAVTSLGTIVKVLNAPIDLSKIAHIGGNFLTTTEGELFTISHDGFIYSKFDMGHFNGDEMKVGGNYFFFHGSLFTVAANGFVTLVGPSTDYGIVKHYGTNFIVNNRGELFTISSLGTVTNIPFNYKLSDISVFSQL